MSMKELRDYRRKNGLCIYCGGERDDEFVNCSSCRKKINLIILATTIKLIETADSNIIANGERRILRRT